MFNTFGYASLYGVSGVVWGSIKDVLKKGMKMFAHGAKVLAVDIYISAALSAKKRELKRVLLSRFKARQLDEIARRLDVSLRGARTKDEKISVLASKLSFDEVVSLAKRYKVRYKDVLEELDRYRAELESKKASIRAEKYIEDLVQALQEFRPEPVRDEEDLEKQLYQYLRARLPNIEIKRQVQVGPYRIDLLVGSCGIELKIPRSATHLQRLIGQARDYSEYLSCVITLILDTGAVRDLSSYIARLEEYGIQPIVVEGKLKK